MGYPTKHFLKDVIADPIIGKVAFILAKTVVTTNKLMSEAGFLSSLQARLLFAFTAYIYLIWGLSYYEISE